MISSKRKKKDLLEVLVVLKNKLGDKELIRRLNLLDKQHQDITKDQIREKVISEVCKVVGIEKSYLLNKQIYVYDINRSKAITFVSAILFDYFDFGLVEIAEMFGMEQSNISKRKNDLNKLDRNNRVDVMTTDIYDKIVDNLCKTKIINKPKQ